MIDKEEIKRHAKAYELTANTIEKDYVLNWLLAGITSSETLHNKWIFKGGTCLKKCYFEAYRFSEDLDFTITDKRHINENFLLNAFSKMADWIYEESGLEIPKEKLSFEEYENTRGKISVEGKVAYKRPMKRRGNLPTVKLDLSGDEIVVKEPILRSIHHPYTDFTRADVKIKAYCIEEIFAEKLRALVERMRPRDLYDVIHLHRDTRWQPDNKLVLDILKKKCAFKGIDIPTMELIYSSPAKQDLDADWHDMLAYQISTLGAASDYWKCLPDVFNWLYKK